jgi:hypothetical protein
MLINSSERQLVRQLFLKVQHECKPRSLNVFQSQSLLVRTQTRLQKESNT